MLLLLLLLAAGTPQVSDETFREQARQCGLKPDQLILTTDAQGQPSAQVAPGGEEDVAHYQALMCMLEWAERSRARLGFVSEPPPGAEAQPISPVSAQPATADDFLKRGYELLDVESRRYSAVNYDRALGHSRDALAHFDRATELDPGSSLAFSLQALALINLGRLDEAEIAVARAVSAAPVHPRLCQVSGLLHARRRRFDQAIKDFTCYLDVANPTSVKALYERAIAHERIGELQEARADLQRGVAFGPDGQLLVVLARVTARLGDVDEALRILDKALPRLASATLEPWRKAIIRGRLLRSAGREAEARTQYETALHEVDKDLKQSLAGGAQELSKAIKLSEAKVELLVTARRAQEAIDVADRMLAQHPNNVFMLIARCQARLYASQLTKAREDCDVARRNDRTNIRAMFLSGLVFLKLNEPKQAEGEFQAMLGQDSRVEALFGRGIARLRNGDKVAGNADIALARGVSEDPEPDFAELGILP